MRSHSGWIGIISGALMVLTLCASGTRRVSSKDDPANAGATEAMLPSVEFHDAPQIQVTGVDSNSPAHWDGDTLYVFNSYGHPWRNSGPDIGHLGNRISTKPRMILDRQGIQKAMAGAKVSPTKLENGWYPEVIGTGKRETDKVLGRTARFFMAGLSRKTITSLRPGEKAP